MSKYILCIIIYALQCSIPIYAVGLELSDVIKQARDIELQKQLAVKNTVKEIKDNKTVKEQPATETINQKPSIQQDIPTQ